MSVIERQRGAADRLVHRLVRLYTGLVAFGVSLALMLRAGLGLGPWDVLHQALSERTGLQIGWVVVIVSAAVLLAWIPLRQRPGVGTISNMIVVGIVTNLALDLTTAPTGLAARASLLVVGIVLNAVATGLYVGAGMGPGPRDGIMTALAARGRSVRFVRTGIEVSVLAVGVALGGSIGLGTVAYAVAVGPLVQLFLPILTVTGTNE